MFHTQSKNLYYSTSQNTFFKKSHTCYRKSWTWRTKTADGTKQSSWYTRWLCCPSEQLWQAREMGQQKSQIQQYEMHTSKSGEEKPHPPAHPRGPPAGKKSIWGPGGQQIEHVASNEPLQQSSTLSCSRNSIISRLREGITLSSKKVNISVFNISEYIMLFKCIKFLFCYSH